MSDNIENLDDDKLREESLKLLHDQSINWSMLVMISGMRLTGLANMTLKRLLTEEQASAGVYEYMVASARTKARESTDLDDLMKMITDFIPPYLEEERSRLVSAERTSDLMAAARKSKKAICKVAIRDRNTTVRCGQLLLLLGDGTKVVNAIDELLGVPQSYCYVGSGEPVPRESIIYFNHRQSADHGCSTQPLQDWSCTATDKRTWLKSWEGLSNDFDHLVISNINLAGKFPPPKHRTVASQVKQSIATISRCLADNPMRVVAGAFCPEAEPGYRDTVIDYVRGRKNVSYLNLEDL